jgi:hypothetical protein
MSVQGDKNRQATHDFLSKNIFLGCRERRNGSDYLMKMQIRVGQVGPSQKENAHGKGQRDISSPFCWLRSFRSRGGGFTG